VPLALAMNAGPAPAAREINPLVPQELSTAIAKALKRTPDHRYQSARELDAALAAMSGTSSNTRAVDSPDSGSIETPGFATRRGWTIAAAAAAAAVLLLIGVAVRRPLMTGLGLSHRLAARSPCCRSTISVAMRRRGTSGRASRTR
jgi:hypothetical protein